MSGFPAFDLNIPVSIDDRSVANGQSITSSQCGNAFCYTVRLPFVILIAKCYVVAIGERHQMFKSFDIAEVNRGFVVNHLVLTQMLPRERFPIVIIGTIVVYKDRDAFFADLIVD